jgi:NAD(P)-dependent dehydrogenase (short-subunit alcohol dehydrogenase family)
MSTVIVTGATRGIGRAGAVEMARRGAEVGIVGRDPERVRETAAEARGAGGGAQVHEHVADLTSMQDVRRLAAELLETYPRIDVLANNAGAMFTSRHETVDGLEQTFALNHLAPFLLTGLVLDRLEESGGRVVTTASDAHRSGLLDLDDLQSEKGRYKPLTVYGTSKLANILFTRELAHRHPAITANCFHPGVIRTGFGKNDGLMAKVGLTLAAPFLKSPATGAKSMVFLSLDPEAAELDGEYVEDGEVATPNAQAQDDRLAAELWERSEALAAA